MARLGIYTQTPKVLGPADHPQSTVLKVHPLYPDTLYLTFPPKIQELLCPYCVAVGQLCLIQDWLCRYLQKGQHHLREVFSQPLLHNLYNDEGGQREISFGSSLNSNGYCRKPPRCAIRVSFLQCCNMFSGATAAVHQVSSNEEQTPTQCNKTVKKKKEQCVAVALILLLK